MHRPGCGTPWCWQGYTAGRCQREAAPPPPCPHGHEPLSDPHTGGHFCAPWIYGIGSTVFAVFAQHASRQRLYELAVDLGPEAVAARKALVALANSRASHALHRARRASARRLQLGAAFAGLLVALEARACAHSLT